MSESANAGELRTPVRFARIERITDDEGYPEEREVNVFGEGNYIYAKWVNAHGTDAFIAMREQVSEPATITCRYTDRIDETCLVFKGNDTRAYEIISIDNVREQNRWLEIKVKRRVAAR